jgi:hypothetical protein
LSDSNLGGNRLQFARESKHLPEHWGKGANKTGHVAEFEAIALNQAMDVAFLAECMSPLRSAAQVTLHFSQRQVFRAELIQRAFR